MKEILQRSKSLFVKTPEERIAEARVTELQKRLTVGGRLGAIDQDQLEIYSILSRKATRRVFLARATACALGFGAAAGLAALGIKLTEDDSQSSKKEKQIDARSELLQEIDLLPQSQIKDLLEERVVPYFKTPTPFFARRGDFIYPMHTSSVIKEFTIDPNRAKIVDATFSAVAPIFSPEPLHLTGETILKIPLVAGLVQEHEKRLFSPENHASDGTIVFNVRLTPQDNIIEGLAPQITIVRPSPVIVPQDSKDMIDEFERIAFIKEAASILLYDILVEQTYLKMKELGFPIYAQARKSDGKIVQAQMVHSLITTINNQNSRLLAALDAGGIIVALKAMEKSESLSLGKGARGFAPIIDSLPTINLGNDAPTILSRAFTWSINYPEVHSLPIRGDMKKIP